MASYLSLVAGVTTVDEDVSARHEGAGVAGEEDGQAVEVIDGAEAVLGRQGAPDLLLGLEGGDAVERRVHVAGGDAVDADAVLGPLGGERLAQLHHARLGGVVAALLLRVVDDGPAHAGHEDDGAGLVRLHHRPPDRLRHQERPRQVDVDQPPEHGRVVRLGLDVGVGDARAVDQHVRRAVQLLDRLERRVDGRAVAHVHLEERHGQARLLVQLARRLVAELLVGVEDDERLGARLGARARDVVAEPPGAAGDDDHLAHDRHPLHRRRQGLVDLRGQGLDRAVLFGRDRPRLAPRAAADGDAARGGALGVWRVDRHGDFVLANGVAL